MSYLSPPGQVTPRQTHLTVYACPSYQLSVTNLLVSDFKTFNPSDLWARSLDKIVEMVLS